MNEEEEDEVVKKPTNNDMEEKIKKEKEDIRPHFSFCIRVSFLFIVIKKII